jgi:hypothetical protein
VTARLLLTGLTLLVLTAPLEAQGRLPAGGWEVFRFWLHMQHTRIEPVTNAQDILNEPQRSMIVIVGETHTLHQVLSSDQLKWFVKSGGSILIATDTPNPQPPHRKGRVQDLGWGEAFGGITITGREVGSGRGANYGPGQHRPFVAPRMKDIRLQMASPYDLFEGFEDAGRRSVATDRPSEMLVPHAWGLLRGDQLAGYPESAVITWDNRPVRADRSTFGFSLWNQGQPGRLLVLADRDVFSNGMLGFVPDESETGYHFDNANWEFANRTILWLQQGGVRNALRRRCLFIQDGEIIEKFAYELPKPPRPPIPDIPPDVLANILLNHSNAVIDDLQQKNFFNRVMEGFLGLPRIIRIFLLFATILFLFFALRWLLRGYRKAEPAGVGPAAQAALIPRGGVLRQRTAAQIEVGNLYEAAARRVRDRFDILGGPPGSDGRMPPVLIAVDVRDGPMITQTVRWLWAIGYGESPVPVPPVEWDRMNNLLERVTARVARGDWSFGADV